MPAWKGTLGEEQLNTLSRYVVDPANVPEGKDLFTQYCSNCHGENIPKVDDADQARQIIASGGPHKTMPVWGDVLTTEQIDALVQFTQDAAKGTSIEKGKQLFDQNCTPCHGDFGEGGLNPARPGDIIAPISSAEFLKTRDDLTLTAIISQGQPSFGMSPFGMANGGQLDDTDIDAIVAFIRSWEANPPVELPPEIPTSEAPLQGPQIYTSLCSQCHGENGEGTSVASALRDPSFQEANTDQEIFDSINLGHKATPMIAWGEILTSDQITQLVKIIRQFREAKPQETQGAPSFANDILPIFEQDCQICHGSLGGWDASSYQSVMTTGDHAPVVIPGDAPIVY
jgi:mono/diheme cytochrome c family protein